MILPGVLQSSTVSPSPLPSLVGGTSTDQDSAPTIHYPATQQVQYIEVGCTMGDSNITGNWWDPTNFGFP